MKLRNRTARLVSVTKKPTPQALLIQDVLDKIKGWTYKVELVLGESCVELNPFNRTTTLKANRKEFNVYNAKYQKLHYGGTTALIKTIEAILFAIATCSLFGDNSPARIFLTALKNRNL